MIGALLAATGASAMPGGGAAGPGAPEAEGPSASSTRFLRDPTTNIVYRTWEVAPGIAVSSRRAGVEEDVITPEALRTWGVVKSLIGELLAHEPSRTLVETVPDLLPGGLHWYNRFLSLDGRTSPIRIVIAPAGDWGAHAVSPPNARQGLGSDAWVFASSDRVNSYFGAGAGDIRAFPPVGSLAHELYHAVQDLAGAAVPPQYWLSVPTPVFTGELGSPGVRANDLGVEVKVAELLTNGGPRGLEAVKEWFLPSPADDADGDSDMDSVSVPGSDSDSDGDGFSGGEAGGGGDAGSGSGDDSGSDSGSDSAPAGERPPGTDHFDESFFERGGNPFLVDALRRAEADIVITAREPEPWRSMFAARARALERLVAQQPTEVRIVAALGLPAREEYISAVRRITTRALIGSVGPFARLGPVGAGDLLRPLESAGLRFDGSLEEILAGRQDPTRRPLVPMHTGVAPSAEICAGCRERPLGAAGSVPSGPAEGNGPGSQNVAGGEPMSAKSPRPVDPALTLDEISRVASQATGDALSGPVFDDVAGVKARSVSAGDLNFIGPESARASVPTLVEDLRGNAATYLFTLLHWFVQASTESDGALRGLMNVPLLGSSLGVANAAQSGNDLALAAAVMNLLSDSFGLASLAVPQLAPAAMVFGTVAPVVQAFKEAFPDPANPKNWSQEEQIRYVSQQWAPQALKNAEASVPRVFSALQDRFESAQKQIVWNAVVAQSLVSEHAARTGEDPAVTADAKQRIRDAAALNLVSLSKGFQDGARAAVEKLLEPLNGGDTYQAFVRDGLITLVGNYYTVGGHSRSDDDQTRRMDAMLAANQTPITMDSPTVAALVEAGAAASFRPAAIPEDTPVTDRVLPWALALAEDPVTRTIERTGVLTGTGAAGQSITVVRRSDSAVLCSAIVNERGYWRCTPDAHAIPGGQTDVLELRPAAAGGTPLLASKPYSSAPVDTQATLDAVDPVPSGSTSVVLKGRLTRLPKDGAVTPEPGEGTAFGSATLPSAGVAVAPDGTFTATLPLNPARQGVQQTGVRVRGWNAYGDWTEFTVTTPVTVLPATGAEVATTTQGAVAIDLPTRSVAVPDASTQTVLVSGRVVDSQFTRGEITVRYEGTKYTRDNPWITLPRHVRLNSDGTFSFDLILANTLIGEDVPFSVHYENGVTRHFHTAYSTAHVHPAGGG